MPLSESSGGEEIEIVKFLLAADVVTGFRVDLVGFERDAFFGETM